MLSLFLTLLFSLNFTESKEDNPKGPMMPLESEKLKKIISLKENCSKVKIIEWKQSDKSSYQTSQSENVISDVCNKAVINFYKFSNIKKKNEFLQTISILPRGESYRYLNDSTYRFYYRSGSYVDGKIIPILGYHQRAAEHIFIFNEILLKNKNEWESNKEFKKILAHEIYHALSYQTGIFNNRIGNKEEKEEAAAQKFASSYNW